MKRSLLVCTALLACLAGGAIVLLELGGGTAPPQEASATATLSSRSVLFGDTVEAKLVLIVPRALAGMVFRGHPSFRPFWVVSTHVDRADLGGGFERIAIGYELTCVSPRCVSTGGGASTEFTFAPTNIAVPGAGSLRAVWPSLVEVSRAQNVNAPSPDGLNAVPATFPGLQPRTYADEALVAAAVSLVALLAAWFYVRLRVRRRAEAAARAATYLQTLLVRVESGLPEDIIYQQRHALDALAVELRHRHINGTLALRAERLAWAPEYPDPAEIRALVTEVRQVAKR